MPRAGRRRTAASRSAPTSVAGGVHECRDEHGRVEDSHVRSALKAFRMLAVDGRLLAVALRVTHSRQPLVDREAGCDSLQFTAEKPLHGLTLPRCPCRKYVTDLVRDVAYRDLHGHDSIMPSSTRAIPASIGSDGGRRPRAGRRQARRRVRARRLPGPRARLQASRSLVPPSRSRRRLGGIRSSRANANQSDRVMRSGSWCSPMENAKSRAQVPGRRRFRNSMGDHVVERRERRDGLARTIKQREVLAVTVQLPIRQLSICQSRSRGERLRPDGPRAPAATPQRGPSDGPPARWYLRMAGRPDACSRSSWCRRVSRPSVSSRPVVALDVQERHVVVRAGRGETRSRRPAGRPAGRCRRLGGRTLRRTPT